MSENFRETLIVPMVTSFSECNHEILFSYSFQLEIVPSSIICLIDSVFLADKNEYIELISCDFIAQR